VEEVYDEPMEVTLVGYIRGFHTKVTKLIFKKKHKLSTL